LLRGFGIKHNNSNKSEDIEKGGMRDTKAFPADSIPDSRTLPLVEELEKGKELHSAVVQERKGGP